MHFGTVFQNIMIQRLQAVQNCAGRIVSCKPRYAHATPVLRELHARNLRNKALIDWSLHWVPQI